MRRFGAAVLAAVGLVAVSAVPASAQDLGDVDVFSLPQLGFEVLQDEGFPGDVVGAQVDPADVAEYCLSVDGLVGNVVNSVDGALPLWTDRPPPLPLNQEQADIFADAVETLRIGVQVFPETAEQLWVETFVLTFADVESQELLGELGSFDPGTGEGSIVVPALDPNVYGLVASCVEVQGWEALVDSGLDAGAIAFWEWIEANDVEVPEDRDPVNEEWQAFVEESALEWVPALITPRAVGIGVFCILNPDGTCGDEPAEEVEVPAEDLVDEAAELVAEAVTARPSFTG